MASRNKRQALLTDELRQVRPRYSQDRKAVQKKEAVFSSEGDEKAEQEIIRSLEEKELQKLKEFDVNVKYGPCIGMTRMERWERAQDLLLDPPDDIKAIIVKHKEKEQFSECLWFDEKGLVP